MVIGLTASVVVRVRVKRKSPHALRNVKSPAVINALRESGSTIDQNTRSLSPLRVQQAQLVVGPGGRELHGGQAADQMHVGGQRLSGVGKFSTARNVWTPQ